MNWISIKDKLPELNTRVLCYNENNLYLNITIDYLECIYGVKEWNSEMGKITHWMNLPSPPENKDE